MALTCTAGMALRCDADELVTCNGEGTGAVSETCALGCNADDLRCNYVDPSNGLATYLDQAAQQSDVALPDGTTISTDNGTVTGPGGAIAVANTLRVAARRADAARADGEIDLCRQCSRNRNGCASDREPTTSP